MPFSQQSLDFLFENRLHDSREWFNEHKADYKALVTEPLSQLITDLTPTMLKIDSLMTCDPKRISRLYRDARLHPDSVFRDHVWYSFRRPKEQHASLPEFYFSVGAGGMEFGCGCYCAPPAVMEAARKLILRGDESFRAAFTALNGQKIFQMYGDLYKRNKYPEQPPEICDWLNRKNMGVSGAITDPEIMFTDKLAKFVAREYKKIAPLYEFYIKAHTLAESI